MSEQFPPRAEFDTREDLNLTLSQHDFQEVSVEAAAKLREGEAAATNIRLETRKGARAAMEAFVYRENGKLVLDQKKPE